MKSFVKNLIDKYRHFAYLDAKYLYLSMKFKNCISRQYNVCNIKYVIFSQLIL